MTDTLFRDVDGRLLIRCPNCETLYTRETLPQEYTQANRVYLVCPSCEQWLTFPDCNPAARPQADPQILGQIKSSLHITQFTLQDHSQSANPPVDMASSTAPAPAPMGNSTSTDFSSPGPPKHRHVSHPTQPQAKPNFAKLSSKAGWIVAGLILTLLTLGILIPFLVWPPNPTDVAPNAENVFVAKPLEIEANPFAELDVSVEDVVKWAESNRFADHRKAIRICCKTPIEKVDPALRRRIAVALEKVSRPKGGISGLALQALRTWAVPENFDRLMETVPMVPQTGVINQKIDLACALAQTRDERALPFLVTIGHHTYIEDLFEPFGSKAFPHLLDSLSTQHRLYVEKATQWMLEKGYDPEQFVLSMLKTLKQEKRHLTGPGAKAIFAISKLPVQAHLRKDVANALLDENIVKQMNSSILGKKEKSYRDALKKWAPKETVETMLVYANLESSICQRFAVNMLAELRDPQAIDILVDEVTQRGVSTNVVEALVAFGPDVEKPLWQKLTSINHKSLSHVIGEIGTEFSLRKLNELEAKLKGSEDYRHPIRKNFVGLEIELLIEARNAILKRQNQW